MSMGMQVMNASGAVILGSDDYTINVLEAFDVAAGVSTSKVYSDDGLYALAAAGSLAVAAMEVPFGDYPAASGNIKKSIGITVADGAVTVVVSGGNRSSHILVITQ